jgi:hypothetical protein
MKKGSAKIAPEAIEKLLASFKVKVDGVTRDDTAVL